MIVNLLEASSYTLPLSSLRDPHPTVNPVIPKGAAKIDTAKA